MQKEFNKKVAVEMDYNFEIEKDWIYAVTITASCRPGWRNKWWLKFKALLEDILDLHLDDEDLRVEIDGIVFNKSSGKRGLFNSPAAFSGTKILGKTKAVTFLIHLAKKKHTIHFIPDGTPYLESIRISKLSPTKKFVANLNIKSEDENYYAWQTFVLVDEPLYSVRITAKTDIGKEQADDDDLRIVINGEIQKNSHNSHPHSYFCGFTARGKEEVFTKEPKLPRGIHYIELFADRRPLLKSIELTLSESKLPQAKIVWTSANLRQEPNTTSAILDQLSENDTVEIVEKAVIGERPKNESGVFLPSNLWHQVATHLNSGFIFSESVEIENESVDEIKTLIKKTATRLQADPDLMLALAEIESLFHPYRVSEKEAYGVFQITQPAIEEIKKEGYHHFVISDPLDIKQNIEAGITYFQKLYSEVFAKVANRVEVCLAGYNMGPTRLPKEGKFDLNDVQIEVQSYVKNVLQRYEFYKREKGFTQMSTLLIGAILLLIITFTYVSIIATKKSGTATANLNVLGIQTKKEIEDYNFNGGMLESGTWEIVVNIREDENAVIRIEQEKKDSELTTYYVKLYLLTKGDKKLIAENIGGPLSWVKLVELDQHYPKELLFETIEGHLAHTRFYRYQDGTFVSIPIVQEDVRTGFWGRDGISFFNQGKELLIFRITQQVTDLKNKCDGSAEVYGYYNNSLIKLNNIHLSKEWCREFKG